MDVRAQTMVVLLGGTRGCTHWQCSSWRGINTLCHVSDPPARSAAAIWQSGTFCLPAIFLPSSSQQ